MGIDSIIVTLSHALVYTTACLMKRPRPTSHVHLCETGSALDIWLVPYMRLGVSVSLTLVGMTFKTEGPERGVIETII